MSKNLIFRLGAGFLTVMLPIGVNVHAEENVYTPPSDKSVHYNWGSGSPDVGFPSDKFTALFDQSRNYAGGDYFIQALADDGVKVEVDGRYLIDRWSNSPVLVTNRALWTAVQEGQHTVKTHYYEDGGNASVFSDIVPFDSWLAYYYPNSTLAGAPTAAKIINPVGELKQLSEKNGSGSPIAGIKSDYFSARYTSAKRIPAGEYIVRAQADDGVRVYVDGNLVMDRWTPAPVLRENAVKIQVSDRADAKEGEKDVHWVEVEYYEGTGNSQVEFSLEPFQKAIEDTWVAEYYPNRLLRGNPYVEGGSNSALKLSSINFDWKSGSPHTSIPIDGYSARFTKSQEFQDGIYDFQIRSDDGVRLWVDNQLVIDSWVDSPGDLKTGRIAIEQGRHTLKVEYFEGSGNANLSMNYQPFVAMPTQIGGEVHYNWGSGSPSSGVPNDKFTALFDQSQAFTSGDYFIQAIADDGVRVEVDEQWMINRWNNSPTLITNRALWTGVQDGQHTVKTYYYEDGGNASIFSDIVKFGSWLAYYYPNRTISGAPTAARVIEPVGNLKSLSEHHGTGIPIEGIKSDFFSARYTTAKRIPAGEYIIRAKADDGVRVYVDGKLVLDRWTPAPILKENAVKIQVSDLVTAKLEEKDIHWIEVEYYEGTGNSQIDFSLEPYQNANESAWVAEYYQNMTLEGPALIMDGSNVDNKIDNIDFNWGAGSPDSMIPSDRFSARYTKIVYFEEGVYNFESISDDGLRVWVDDQIVIDSWVNSDSGNKSGKVMLTKGQHKIKVEYFENGGQARLSLNYLKAPIEEPIIQQPENVKLVSARKLPVYRSFEELIDYGKHLVFYNPSYTRFMELGYGDTVNVLEEKLYTAKIKTSDGQIGWVQKDYLETSLTEDTWLVKEARALRSNASNSSTSLGTIPAGSSVYVLDHVVISGTAYSEWYYIQTQSGQKGWIWGASNPGGNEGYNIIKYEFSNTPYTNKVTIFTPLNTKASITAEQINRFIDYKTGGKLTVMTNMGYAYLKAQEETGLNAIYLLAHSGLETGWGNSSIVKAKYNFYGIGAIDSRPDEGAYNYSTPEGGIIAGAYFIKKNYVDRSWDTDGYFPYSSKPTIDNMRNDNSWHQYATDEAWAVKIGNFANEFNNFINK